MFATLIFQIDRSCCMPDKPAKQLRTSRSKLSDCELRSSRFFSCMPLGKAKRKRVTTLSSSGAT